MVDQLWHKVSEQIFNYELFCVKADYVLMFLYSFVKCFLYLNLLSWLCYAQMYL
jgi:hypothetical protein